MLTLDTSVLRLQKTSKHGRCVVLKSVENKTTNSRPRKVWDMSRFFSSSGKANKNENMNIMFKGFPFFRDSA